MVTPDDLRTTAGSLAAPNNEILIRAAFYLSFDSREGLETAHNLVTDTVCNLVVAGLHVPPELLLFEDDLYNRRISAYGAIGRPAGDLTAPYWRL